RVEMTVKENGEEKTYKADSMDEFTKKYPQMARDYGIGRGGLKAWTFNGNGPEDFAKKFEELRKQFGDFDFGKQDPELQKLLEHPNQLLQETPSKPERLGVRLAPLSQVLADQLGIDAKSGSLLAEIEPGSLA